METSIGSNMRNFYDAMFQQVKRLHDEQRYDEADQLCFRLLANPDLPIFQRAGCNYLLAFGEDDPVDFAEEALRLYKFMLGEMKPEEDSAEDIAKHTRLVEQAEAMVQDARTRSAEDAEANNDEDAEIADDTTAVASDDEALDKLATPMLSSSPVPELQTGDDDDDDNDEDTTTGHNASI